jgi:hypothetical protein
VVGVTVDLDRDVDVEVDHRERLRIARAHAVAVAVEHHVDVALDETEVRDVDRQVLDAHRHRPGDVDVVRVRRVDGELRVADVDLRQARRRVPVRIGAAGADIEADAKLRAGARGHLEREHRALAAADELAGERAQVGLDERHSFLREPDRAAVLDARLPVEALGQGRHAAPCAPAPAARAGAPRDDDDQHDREEMLQDTRHERTSKARVDSSRCARISALARGYPDDGSYASGLPCRKRDVTGRWRPSSRRSRRTSRRA